VGSKQIGADGADRRRAAPARGISDEVGWFYLLFFLCIM